MQVSINGSPVESLTNERREAVAALEAAIAQLRSMTPHGRDFQTEPAEHYCNARQTHERRLGAIVSVADSIREEAFSLFDENKIDDSAVRFPE